LLLVMLLPLLLLLLMMRHQSRRLLQLYDLPRHLLVLVLQVLILELDALELLPDVLISSPIPHRPLPLRARHLGAQRILLRLITLGMTILRQRVGIGVHATQMLVQVLLAREALAGVALAVHVWAVELLARTTVFVVHFAFVTEQAAGVCEAGELFAALGGTFVGPVVLVHVFRPLALSAKVLDGLLASCPVADISPIVILRNWAIRLGNRLRATR